MYKFSSGLSTKEVLLCALLTFGLTTSKGPKSRKRLQRPGPTRRTIHENNMCLQRVCSIFVVNRNFYCIVGFTLERVMATATRLLCGQGRGAHESASTRQITNSGHKLQVLFSLQIVRSSYAFLITPEPTAALAVDPGVWNGV